MSNIVHSTHPSVILPPPIKVLLNGHNIIKAQILDVYRYNNSSSVYTKFTTTPFFSVMHDGITKFATKYNGVLLRAIDENNDPFVVPYQSVTIFPIGQLSHLGKLPKWATFHLDKLPNWATFHLGNLLLTVLDDT